MQKNETANILQEFIRSCVARESNLVLAKVTNVDEDKNTSELLPYNGSSALQDVQLNLYKDATLKIIPAKDTPVLVALSEGMRQAAYVVAVAQPQKIILTTAPDKKTRVEIKDELVQVDMEDKPTVKISPQKIELFEEKNILEPEKIEIFEGKIKLEPEKIDLFEGNIKLEKDKVELGNGGEALVKGDSLKIWAKQVDAALQALIAWGGKGQPPGPSGGIAPLVGVLASNFADDILSSSNKTS